MGEFDKEAGEWIDMVATSQLKPMRLLLWVLAWAGVLLLAFVAIVALIIADAFGHGPYTTWYNDRCLRLATEARLVGRPEADISVVLGPPSYVWDYDEPGPRRKTYNYDPLGLAAGIFQVHCRDGIVAGLEPLDD